MDDNEVVIVRASNGNVHVSVRVSNEEGNYRWWETRVISADRWAKIVKEAGE